jgi:hypothetical protein
MGILLVYDVTDESSFNSISFFLLPLTCSFYQAFVAQLVLVSQINWKRKMANMKLYIFMIPDPIFM